MAVDRGIIPAVLCQQLEECNNNRPLSSLFDVIAGTSTGGILALGFSIPPHGKSAKDLVDFYFKNGRRIFSGPRGSLSQYRNPKFDNKKLRAAATELFGATKIGDATTEVFITSYDTQLRNPVYFTRSEARTDGSVNLMMRDIALATSAAPTIFPAQRFDGRVLVDGGVVANNPACLAYAHAKRLWPNQEILVLSMGTGTLNRPLADLKTKDWGQIQWVRPLLDSLFAGTAETVNDFFRYTHLPNYLRLQGGLNNDNEALDNASQRAMDGLKSLALSIFRNQEGAIIDFVSRLKAAGENLTLNITSPFRNALVSPGPMRVEGTISNYKNEHIYAFTGKLGKYWPSERVIPNGDRWSAQLNAGQSASNATIFLANVEPLLADYIEFYRHNGVALQHQGIKIPGLNNVLDQMELNIDHRQH